MPYRASDHSRSVDRDELRARIPGWGADLDHANRPAVPKERTDLPTGAHWDLPEDQPELISRERSIEHARLTPVFGTVAPLRGVSGRIRRFAYDRYSEGRALHWLLLVLGDRVDVIESRVASAMQGHPDDWIGETGIGVERWAHPLSSRFGRGRADVKHTWIDPLIVAAPLVIGVGVVLLSRRGRR